MFEIGVVDSVNEKNGTAKVVFDRKSACDKCGMCLTAKGEKMKVYVEVKNTLGAKVGDKVGVSMSDRFVLRAAFIVYLIPVILVGAGLAVFRKFSDMVLLAVIAVGLLLGAAVGILADRLIRKKGTNAPRMSQIISQKDDQTDDESAESADTAHSAGASEETPANENASEGDDQSKIQ